ncbi:MAG: toll/interleukin-1 receptor domain-containing protein [Bryobacteraceae bacterium]
MVNLFISYSHKDNAFREELETHLAMLRNSGRVAVWTDRQIDASMEWEAEIWSHFEAARVLVLLISPDFLASKFCYSQELGAAMARHEARTARVIPVIIRPCQWQDAPFAKIQCLCAPKPVSLYGKDPVDRDEAWAAVADQIRKIVIQTDSIPNG